MYQFLLWFYIMFRMPFSTLTFTQNHLSFSVSICVIFHIYIIDEFQVHVCVLGEEWILFYLFPNGYLVHPGSLVRSSYLPQYFEIAPSSNTLFLCLFPKCIPLAWCLCTLCQALFEKDFKAYFNNCWVSQFLSSSFSVLSLKFSCIYFSIWTLVSTCIAQSNYWYFFWNLIECINHLLRSDFLLILRHTFIFEG